MLWEDLSSSELEKACIETGGTCIIPIGVIEKHGNHLPLGTDMIVARKIAEDVVKIEPAVIFPYYYFGQINEARHVPGTIAVSQRLMFDLLNEVCSEVARNGFKKIIILNSHGGNPYFLKSFIQCSLHERKDYIVYLIECTLPEKNALNIKEMLNNKEFGDHAGNLETSLIMAVRPDLVKMENVDNENMEGLGRLDKLGDSFTAIFWYADHPAHFAGNPNEANIEAGKKAYMLMTQKIANDVKSIKEDRTALELQNEFFG